MLQFFHSLGAAGENASFNHLAIGFFDGLHLGHRAVICGNRDRGGLEKTCVFTFEPHPIAVLNPENQPPLITGLAHKLKILGDWRAGSVLAFPFSLERSRQDPLDFLRELTAALPSVRSISVGTRWRFGHERRGDVETLRSFCFPLGIRVEICEPVGHGGELISSSRLRAVIRAGGLDEAGKMLGRPFRFFGTVAKGRQLGRSIGVPTANLLTSDECLPPLGVYAGSATLATGEKIPAAINLGRRPTIDQVPGIHIEAHLLDFERDLYGQELYLEPQHFLRHEQKFASIGELKSAIIADIADTRSRLHL